MMMKVTVNEKSQEKKYPWIGINNLNKSIVLFVSENNGVTLKSGSSHHEIGECSINWDEKLFESFDYEITLSND
jgi:hypothetical protein